MIQSFCLSVSLSISLSVNQPFCLIYQSAGLVYQSAGLSVYQSVCLSVCISTYPLFLCCGEV